MAVAAETTRSRGQTRPGWRGPASRTRAPARTWSGRGPAPSPPAASATAARAPAAPGERPSEVPAHRSRSRSRACGGGAAAGTVMRPPAIAPPGQRRAATGSSSAPASGRACLFWRWRRVLELVASLRDPVWWCRRRSALLWRGHYGELVYALSHSPRRKRGGSFAGGFDICRADPVDSGAGTKPWSPCQWGCVHGRGADAEKRGLPREETVQT